VGGRVVGSVDGGVTARPVDQVRERIHFRGHPSSGPCHPDVGFRAAIACFIGLLLDIIGTRLGIIGRRADQ